MDKDRSLLFIVLGISLRHFDAQTIQPFIAEWEIEPSQNLPDRLLRAGIISRQVYETLLDIAGLVVKVHGGDAGAALRVFGGETTIIDPRDPSTMTDPFFSSQATALPEVEGVKEIPGRYSDIAEHGRGGFGRVLLVHDSHLDRDIAMKELLPVEVQSDDLDAGIDSNTPTRRTLEIVSRFLREARVTSQLEHPSVVPVYELGRRSDGALYYTMRFVRGITLAAAFRERKTLTRRIELLPHFVDLCNAIAYAHSKGIIHRDIKPGNVMIGDFGETAVLDWGLAKPLKQTETHTWELRETMRAMHIDEEEAVTQTLYGRALGTPAYVSPEQALGRLDEIRECSDVYSLGAVLYELLTGRVPYVGITAHDVLDKVVAGPPRPVHTVEPLVPPELAAICHKAMAHDPRNRYKSAKELAEEIQRFLAGALVDAYRYTLRQRFLRYIARRKAVFATAGTAALLILAVAAASYVRIVIERDRAVSAQAMAEQRLYETSILLASSQIDRRNFDVARSNLEKAPLPYRNWEWNYLKRRCHQDLLTYHLHTKPVVSATLSPDKSSLLTASYDGSARIVALDSWKTLHLFQDFPAPLLYAEFHPDGKQVLFMASDGDITVRDIATHANTFVLTASEGPRWAHFTQDGTRIFAHRGREPVRFWDASTGKEIRTFSPLDPQYPDLSVSNDGSRVFMFASDQTLHVFDSQNGSKLGSISATNDSQIAYAPKTSRIVTVDRNKQVRLWDANTFVLLGTLPVNLERCTYAQLTPKEDAIAVYGVPGDVYLFRLDPFELASHYSCQPDMITDAQFNASGSLLVTASTDHTLTVSDPLAGKILSVFEGHSDLVHGAFFLPDDRTVVSYSQDDTLKVWGMDENPNSDVLVRHALRQGVNETLFSPDGQHVMVFGLDYSVGIWDAKSHEKRFEIRENKGNVLYAAWSPDSTRFAIASTESVANHEAATGRILFHLDGFAEDIRLLRYSPGGDVILGGFSDGTAMLWDATAGQLLSSFSGGRSPLQCAEFSPDGSRIVAGYESGRILAWSRRDGHETQIQPDGGKGIAALAFSPGGEQCVALVSPSLTRMFDVQTGALLRETSHDATGLAGVAYSPDGMIIAVRTEDSTVEILDRHGNFKTSMEGHDRYISAAAFSPDSTRLVTASYDSTVRVWDVFTGKELLRLSGHTNKVRSAQFSPDGLTIVTGSWDGDIRFWSGAPCRPVDIRE